MSAPETKTVTIRVTWATHHTVELPADFDVENAGLEDFPSEVLEQITTGGAEPVDWEEVR